VLESLPVGLNGGSVHAIDAPETFTVRGPFHLEFANEGGAVHVHVHLDDNLSQVAQLRAVNHYVESGETTRVPVGTVSGHGEVTGYLDVVTGYGAERERIEVTVATDAGGDGGDEPRRERDSAADSRESTEQTVGTAAAGPSTGHSMERSATGMGVRGLANRSLPEFPASVGTDTRGGLAFVGLAAATAAIGGAVILTVGDLLLSLVVATVVVVAVAAVGWLLLG